jgi:hypothetical protein
MTEYEQGRHDATGDILTEFRKFKFNDDGRKHAYFDEADILEIGCPHCKGKRQFNRLQKILNTLSKSAKTITKKPDDDDIKLSKDAA